MMIGALLVLGLFSYLQMPVKLFPDIDFPFVVVQTVYPGASAETVESEVTERIEEVANQVSGVRSIFAQSREGYSLVFIEFELEIEGATASQDVREKVSGIRADLPDDIEEPIVSQYDPGAEPIISLALSGQRTPKEITRLAEEVIKPRIEPVSGVGRAEIIGGSEREIRLALDPLKMEAHGITVDDVRYSVMTSNLEIPGGRIEEQSQEYLVRMQGRLERVAQFDSIIVKNVQGVPVYMYEIATVLDTIVEQRSLARYNGESAIGIEVVRQSDANVVETAEGVRQVVRELDEQLPPDLNIEIVEDQSDWINDAIHEIQTNMAFGTALAVIVILLFLLNWRPTLITGLAIPISIVATFTFMRFLGFSINLMTLLGLSLAVGILVDDAIVVIENIYRHLDEGKSPIKAAMEGTGQIGLAVIAATSTIIVVFLPVAFMSGIVGRFFYQFGMSVAFAVATSLFVAFTLTPMLSGRMLRRQTDEEGRPVSLEDLRRPKNPLLRILNYWNVAFEKIKPVYRNWLAWSLRHRFIVLSVATVAFFAALWVATLVGSEFMPQSDEAKMAIDLKAPPGTDLDATMDYFRSAENILRDNIGDVIEDTYISVGGANRPVNEGRLLVLLTDAAERELSANQYMDSSRALLKGIAGVKVAIGSGEGEGGGEKPIEISIRGDDLDELARLAHKVERIASEVPGAVDIDNTLQEGKPELHIDVDRKLADDLGLDLSGIATTIRHLVEGDVVSTFKDEDEEYDIRIQLAEQYRQEADDVGRLLIESQKKVPGHDPFLVPLNRVAELNKTTAIGEYLRYDRQREVRVNANVATGAFAGTVANQIMTEAEKLDLPPGYKITTVGQQEIMEESFQNIFQALLLSVIFIYLVLASQYESFHDPLSIMVSLPLSIVGAMLGLLAFGSSVSLMSLIGIVMLMGLVTKNAILLIDFVKQARASGVNRTEAILQAGPIRLRPILMTSFATVFGMLPLALELGPGAEFRSGMARAVIGGMISSTALTLIVVPVVYTVVEDFVNFIFRRGRKDKEQTAETQTQV
jgi:HAE1 family hydrophobic/amphiphilic exporter-1